MAALIDAVRGLAISQAFRDQVGWLWPLCESLHFLALCVLIGAAGLFDQLHVLVVHNPGKEAMLPIAQRQALLEQSIQEEGIEGDVIVAAWSMGLLVDYATDALIIEVTGDQGKVQAFLKAVEPFGIKELAQSGLLALGRGGKSITERVMRG